jgi:hypothetical protein
MVAQVPQAALRIDREQAQRQLQLLGDEPGDKVFVTAFFPKGDPRTKGENRDKGRKSDRLNYEQIEAWQAQGRGVYLVANGYGHGKKDVSLCRTIFYEHDNLSKEIQLYLWQSLGIPEPTFQVDTEGKSIHNYWVLEEPIHPELWAFQESDGTWKGLQADLLHFANADTSLTNPNRVMRLAGAWYMQWDEAQGKSIAVGQSRIVGGCGKRYSYAELRAIIPRQQSQRLPKQQNNQQRDNSNDLLDFRSVGHQLPHWNDHGRSGWATFQCPVHTGDGKKHSTDHIHVNLSNGAWEAHCGCDRKVIYQAVCEIIGHKPAGRSFAGGIGNGGGKRCGSGGSGGDGGDGGDVYTARSKQNARVTGDSRINGDSHNVDLLSVAATVTSVTEVLKSGFPDWMEISKLEAIRVKSELSYKQAFYALVGGIKNQFDEVQPEDEVRLKTLIDWYNARLDFNQALPSMAGDILHDAAVLNIDPIGVWQYLLPAVLSLAGKRVDLSLGSHDIPAIVWTAIIAESGTGKTRAEKLITSPLKQLQKQARERFKAESEEWEETIANWEKGNGKRPPKPVERKYLFDVATIQAVMRRQSEQGMNGSLWARDELVGLFQSFGQFNKGDNEALSCLATSWDGGSSQVDRINQEDSYIIESSRLSIAGGLQPGMFKKAFKDPSDSQGLQARFLFAAMKPKKPKRVKGFCHLSEKLPAMYQWLDNLPEGKIKLSIEADRYYDKLYEAIGEQAFNTSMPAIRAWMFKLPSHLLRIALGLHLIECYHDPSRPLWTLQKDTLERAVLFAQYYRSTFHIVQTTAVDTADISAILLQIWDKAVTRHPEGISTRDAYREIKNIQYLAKEAGRPVASYTADLFGKLTEMGKGSVVKQGRLIKFVANLNPSQLDPDYLGGVKPDFTPPGDRVTVAETLDISTSEVSPPSVVSPVTLQNNLGIDVLQNEVPSKVEKAITSPTLDEVAPACLALVECTDATDTSTVGEPIIEEEVVEGGLEQPTLIEQIESTSADESEEVASATSEPSPLPQEPSIEVGDLVIWDECPAHCASLAPFEVTAIEGDFAKLDLFEKRVALSELRIA